METVNGKSKLLGELQVFLFSAVCLQIMINILYFYSYHKKRHGVLSTLIGTCRVRIFQMTMTVFFITDLSKLFSCNRVTLLYGLIWLVLCPQRTVIPFFQAIWVSFLSQILKYFQSSPCKYFPF